MIVVIDYGLGNLRSVAGAVSRLKFPVLISSDPKDLENAEKLILPGVGSFGDGIGNIRNLKIYELLDRLVRKERKPILGICLGAQLMARESFEFGHHKGFGWINASVVKLESVSFGFRLPHVGWNELIQLRQDPLFDGVKQNELFYFVHSFHIDCMQNGGAIGACDYGQRFFAAFHQDNIFATQFHPEKSQQQGLKLLENFLKL